MREPTHDQAFQVLLLQAADEGRGPTLFGDSLERAKETVPAFLVGERFPSVYLEHPLLGDPFLDVTVLLNQIEPNTRIASPAAGEHAALLDWYSQAHRLHEDISLGFEIDTKEVTLPLSAVHFQPREHLELVRPFCEAAGAPHAAERYLALAERMPQEWLPSFFGMFRGRPDTPLRVCGYLGHYEKSTCAANPGHLAAVFDAIGFTAYDDAMLSQVSALMAKAPGIIDYQLDVYPDGSIGSIFALDVQFAIERPEAVQTSFESGPGAAVMHLLEDWGIADSRWKASVRSAFARGLPVESGGTTKPYSLTLMPQWAKARWMSGVLQPAKLYHLASAGILE